MEWIALILLNWYLYKKKCCVKLVTAVKQLYTIITTIIMTTTNSFALSTYRAYRLQQACEKCSKSSTRETFLSAKSNMYYNIKISTSGTVIFTLLSYYV